jgi:hypothetical protein
MKCHNLHSNKATNKVLVPTKVEGFYLQDIGRTKNYIPCSLLRNNDLYPTMQLAISFPNSRFDVAKGYAVKTSPEKLP